jgi:CRP/FNR family cyclic AMP-dependent transcriptional regulator
MDTSQLPELLRGHPLMKPLSEDQLLSFAKAGELELYEPGEVIVTEGTLGDAIYLILSGRSHVCKKKAGDRELAELCEGEFFGEMSLVEATARSATVVVTTPTRVFRLPNQELQRLAEEDPQCMNRVLVVIVRTLSSRLRRMNDTLATVAQLSDWLAGTIV